MLAPFLGHRIASKDVLWKYIWSFFFSFFFILKTHHVLLLYISYIYEFLGWLGLHVILMWYFSYFYPQLILFYYIQLLQPYPIYNISLIFIMWVITNFKNKISHPFKYKRVIDRLIYSILYIQDNHPSKRAITHERFQFALNLIPLMQIQNNLWIMIKKEQQTADMLLCRVNLKNFRNTINSHHNCTTIEIPCYQ